MKFLIYWDDNGKESKIEIRKFNGFNYMPIKYYKGDPVKIFKKISEEIEDAKR